MSAQQKSISTFKLFQPPPPSEVNTRNLSYLKTVGRLLINVHYAIYASGSFPLCLYPARSVVRRRSNIMLTVDNFSMFRQTRAFLRLHSHCTADLINFQCCYSNESSGRKIKEHSRKQFADATLRTFLVLSCSQNPLSENKCCCRAADSKRKKKHHRIALLPLRFI